MMPVFATWFDFRLKWCINDLPPVTICPKTSSTNPPATHPIGTGDTLSVWVKWPGRGADHSPLPSAEVKNA
jgi:hypothetical protein